MLNHSCAVSGTVVELNAISVDPVFDPMMSAREKMHGREKAEKSFPSYEWQRLSLVLNQLQSGERCLEVGPGRGYLSKAINQKKLFAQQVAIDIVPAKSPKSKFGESVDFREMSIENIEFPDGYFDTIICMEVLEHLDDRAFVSGLNEVRRVCSRSLIISVPFLEPEPLPSYHKQRFSAERVSATFGGSKFFLMKTPVMRVPWVLIFESM